MTITSDWSETSVAVLCGLYWLEQFRLASQYIKLILAGFPYQGEYMRDMFIYIYCGIIVYDIYYICIQGYPWN